MKLEMISKYPSVKKKSVPILFVHGAWHAAWCWDVHFLEYFAKHGFEAHAVSLRGHGKSEGREKLGWTRISDYVEDVEKTVQQFSIPPVIIGHSMGGLVVQKYLEHSSAPCAVLLATVPTAGVLATTIRIALKHPIAFAKVHFSLSLFPLVATSGLAREAFFSEGFADEELLTYSKLLQDESYLGFLDMLVFNLPKPKKVKTPMLVLGAERDTMFHPREIEKTAMAYNTKAEIFTDMAHDMMLELKWQDVAERIIAWIGEQEVLNS
ncbi:MAG: alpha/beta hydrolase [Desulfobacula sp.]|nr:alpha/beta hydrolase [Desulfobacula sp.]